MTLPVVIVTSGGLPVTVATSGLGTPMVAAATGLAVTFAASGGLPVVGISSGPPAAPVNTVAPFIVGTPAVGQTLTAATGSWTGSPAPTYTYQWKRGGVNIGSATASTYLLVSADLAAMMTVTVTATNSQGNASATSAAVGPVAAGAVAPANTVLPTIDDTTPTVGQVLTATPGTWTGTPTITYAYQWVRTAAASGDADVTAWKAAVVTAGGTVSAGRETAVTTFVTALKSAGLWTTLDRYWLFAAENTQSSFIDIKSLQTLTASGTPSFVANQGWLTSTGGNNISTNFTPSTSGVNYTLNSATAGCWVATARAVVGSNEFEFGASNAAYTSAVSINIFFNGTGSGVDTYNSSRINCITSLDGEYTRTHPGSFMITRTGASATALYDNGSSATFPTGGGVATTASVSLPDVPISIGALNLGGTIGFYGQTRIASFYVASGWNGTQALAFYNAERALMTAVGLP